MQPDGAVLHRSTVARTGSGRWQATCSVCQWERWEDDHETAVAAAERHARPALEFLVAPPGVRWGHDYGPGSFCPDCPFRDPAPPYEEREGIRIDNDPTEAHYDCRLLGRKVWGEYSPCELVDWQRRARQELGWPE